MTTLLIASPTSGTVHTVYAKSLMATTLSLREKGIKSSYLTFEFSDICASRNYLMSYFLTQKQFTHALFIDSDMSWPIDQVYRLLHADKPFVAAYYPDRRPRWNRLRQMIEAEAQLPDNKKTPVRRLLAGTQHYVSTRAVENGRTMTVQRDGDFETLATIGFGFVLLKREVPEKMVEAGAAKPLPRMGKLDIYRGAEQFHDFFSHLETVDGKALLGEDQSFCHRWIRQCDGKIWGDLKSRINHSGDFTFIGDYEATRDD